MPEFNYFGVEDPKLLKSHKMFCILPAGVYLVMKRLSMPHKSWS